MLERTEGKCPQGERERERQGLEWVKASGNGGVRMEMCDCINPPSAYSGTKHLRRSEAIT